MLVRNLKSKSLENIESADLLVAKGFFDSSVHCSYYGCLQLIKLVLKEKANIDFDIQCKESKSDSRGYHNYYLERFRTIFKNGPLKYDTVIQINNVRKLRELRVQADYDPVHVEATKCSGAVATAKEFSNFIFNDIKLRI